MEFIPPFTDADGMVRFIRGTLRRGKDIMIGNEGPEGSGKSTTSGNLAKAISPDFDMRRDTIKDMDHLLQVLHETEKRRLYVLDEAVNVFHNQDWATWEAKSLSRLIRQMRIMESVWILNLPDYAGLHPYVREARIPLRIYHPPVYDADGMGNGPSQVFWKHQWFSYKHQEVVHRWQCIIDELHANKLDQLPEWQGYEQDKVANFRELVGAMITRRQAEAAKEARAAKRTAASKGKGHKAPTPKPIDADLDRGTDTPPLLRRGGPPNVVA